MMHPARMHSTRFGQQFQGCVPIARSFASPLTSARDNASASTRMGQSSSEGRALLPVGMPFRCVAPYQCVLYNYDVNANWAVNGSVLRGAVVTVAPPPAAPVANVIGPWMLIRGMTSAGVREGWVLRRDVAPISLNPRVPVIRRGNETTLSLPTEVLR